MTKGGKGGMFLLYFTLWSAMTLLQRTYVDGAIYDDSRPFCVIECNGFMEDNLTITWTLPRDVISFHNESDLHSIVTWTSDYSYGNCTITTLTSCICFYGNNDVMDSDSIFSLNVTIVDEGHVAVFKAEWTVDSENCLKPPQVNNVTLNSINSTCVKVTWYPNVTCPKDSFYQTEVYRISYRRTGVDTNWVKRNCGQLCMDCTNPYTICELSPFTDYDVILQRKLLGANNQPTGHWSEYTILTTRTKEDVPAGSPDVLEGGYTVINNKCEQGSIIVIRIYWKEVRNHLRNGNITMYEIVVVNVRTNESEHFRTTTRLYHYDVTLKCETGYDVTLFAGTHAGLSAHFSKMFVNGTSEETDDIKAGFVIPEISMDHQFINFTMLDGGTMTEYENSVWCETDLKNACKGPIDWMEITSSNTALTINTSSVPLVLTKLKVGVVKHDTGITWCPCLYVQTNIMPRPNNLHVIPSYIEDGGVTVAWDAMPCSKGHTKPYLVSIKLYVCPCADSDSPECLGPTTEYTLDGWCTSYEIPNLNEDTTYKINAIAVGTRGIQSPQSDTIYAKPEVKGSFFRSNIVKAAAIILVISTLVSSFFLLRKLARRLVRKAKAHYRRIAEIGELELHNMPDG